MDAQRTARTLPPAWAWALAVLMAVLLALSAAGPASAAGGPLVLARAEAGGLRAAPAPAAAIRNRLVRTLPPAARAAGRRAAVQASAFRTGGDTLTSVALVAGPRARALATALTRASGAGGRRVTRLRIGDGGAVALPRGRRVRDATAVWRVGGAVGVVQVRTRRPAVGLRAMALGYARAQAAKMRRFARTSAWQRVLDQVPARGPVPVGLARQAFVLAYGPLPGVARPAGPRAPIEDASMAARWILASWSRLTPAQRTVAARRMGIAPPGATIGERRSAAREHALGDPGFTPDAAIQAKAEGFANTYSAQLGVPRTLKLVAGTTTTNVNGFADAFPVTDAGEFKPSGTTTTCRVRIAPPGQAAAEPFKTLVIAHEVFHCFEFEIMGAGALVAGVRRDWILEGLADWAALRTVPVSFDVGGGNVKWYLTTPGKNLFTRTYDSVGFWGQAERATGSLWPRIRGIISASPNDAGVFSNATGGASVTFLNSWSSSAFRPGYASQDWVTADPLVAPNNAALPGNVQSAWTLGGIVGADAYTTAQYTITQPDPTTPLLYAAVKGGRISDGSVDDVNVEDDWFCLSGECKCPKGTEGDPPQAVKLGVPASLAVTGGTSGTVGSLRARSLAEYCKTKKKPPKPPKPPKKNKGGMGCGKGRCGGTNGDPHQETFDGLRYDFQAAGEFTLVRSDSGDLEVQARQQTWGNVKLVTVDTALAMRVGDARVQIDKGEPLLVRVGGQTVPVPADTAPQPLPGGGTLARAEDQVEVTWPDGTVARVWSVGSWGVAMTMQPASARAGHLTGLLGDFDGSTANDLTTRQGERIDPAAATADTDAGFDLLYKRFGESWRISQAESLFDYPPGASTATYTDRSVPTQLLSLGSLAARLRSSAESTCRAAGITDQEILDDCILDVAVTGDPAFATSAAQEQQQDAPPPPIPVDWTPVPDLATRSSSIGLAVTGDGVLHAVAATRDAADADQVVHVPIGAAGAAGAASLVESLGGGNPTLAVRPDGGLHLTLSTIRLLPSPQPSELGTLTYDAPASGSPWTPGTPVSTQGFAYAGEGIAAFGPGGVPFTVLSTNGYARIFRGLGGTTGADPIPGSGCASVNPSIATDGAGVWAAWVQALCPDQGYFAAPVDPATGVPGTPVKAPGSSFDVGGSPSYVDARPRVALATRPGAEGVWMAYGTRQGNDGHVLVWRLGSAEPPVDVGVIPGGSPSYVFLTTGPDGVMWVAWVDGGGTLTARRWTPASGWEGRTLTPSGPPTDLPGALDWAVAARAGRLDMLAGPRAGRGASTTTWHAAITP